jgi:CubicO group peptidase (beta-lactamase class C family)
MRILVLIALILDGSKAGFPQLPVTKTAETQVRRRLDEKVPVWLKAFNVTGVGIAYIEDEKIAWTAFYGEQLPGGPRANEQTLYSVVSLTKPISAEIILRLVSAGTLSLDEAISPYRIDPDVKDNPWTRLLTPRLCLSHQSGFTNWRYQTGNVLKLQWWPNGLWLLG